MNQSYDEAFASGEVVSLGLLSVPSGRVLACDPFFVDGAYPFGRAVDAGSYEVELLRVSAGSAGKRIRLARLVIAPRARANVYEPALFDGSASNRYSVDSGLGCFMDQTAGRALAAEFGEFYRRNPAGNYYSDVLEPAFQRNAVAGEARKVGDWCLYGIPGSSLAAALFASGMGDGRYGSYWGLDDRGKVLSLVTDFAVEVSQ